MAGGATGSSDTAYSLFKKFDVKLPAILCVTHLLTADQTVPSGDTCFHSNTKLDTGVTLRIEGTGEFHIIGTGG